MNPTKQEKLKLGSALISISRLTIPAKPSFTVLRLILDGLSGWIVGYRAESDPMPERVSLPSVRSFEDFSAILRQALVDYADHVAAQSKLTTEQPPDITRLAEQATDEIVDWLMGEHDPSQDKSLRPWIIAIIERVFTGNFGANAAQMMQTVCDQRDEAFTRGYEQAREDAAELADCYPVEHRESRRHVGEMVPDGLATKAGIASAIRSLTPNES